MVHTQTVVASSSPPQHPIVSFDWADAPPVDLAFPFPLVIVPLADLADLADFTAGLASLTMVEKFVCFGGGNESFGGEK